MSTQPEPPSEQFVWPLDPTLLAMEASRWRQPNTVPDPFCIELGRRLLSAQLEFSEWMLRRVDKVGLERDRSVARRATVEFTVRADAPLFTDADGRGLRLVPLALMRRQTMVNLDLRDESGQAVTIPGIRLVQQFDQSILLAAAAALDVEAADDEEVKAFIAAAIAGKVDQVESAYAAFDDLDHLDQPDSKNHWLRRLRQYPLFQAAASRLRHNFTLYVFLRDDQPRHTLLNMSFDEPTSWLYQKPRLGESSPESGVWNYQVGPSRSLSLGRLWAAVGFTATRVRFQVPAAETAASYHFELSTPPGVQIVRATLLAGRPNGDESGRVSVDRIVGHSPTVGLHAIEVPNGSLCRVQVELRAPFRGWLTTILTGAAAVLAVTASVWWHWRGGNPHWIADQVTNLVLLLVTTSAAVTTFVAQRDGGEVGARFVAGVRALGTIAIATPVLVSAVLVYSALRVLPDDRPDPPVALVQHSLFGLMLLAAALLVSIFVAWVCSAYADRDAVIERSPWDMTDRLEHGRTSFWGQVTRRPRQVRRAAIEVSDYMKAVSAYGFDRSAVGVRSAEGWHTSYAWTNAKQGDAIEDLAKLASHTRPNASDGCRRFATRCAAVHDCRQVRLPDAPKPWATPATDSPTATEHA